MKVSQTFRFEAAHYLPHVPETHKCRRMHGHSYRTELILSGPVDERTGFIVDFFEIEDKAGRIISSLDHTCLNEIEGLSNPTVEIIAKWIFDRVEKQIPLLYAVRVYETCDSWAEFSRDDA
jgi:6-pyruvoyltetrahydropterin/6-carboxytetrahydropterin synthase